MSPTILLVDDNPMYRRSLRRNLEIKHYTVLEAEDSRHALEIMAEQEPDVVVTDLDMRTRTEGLELIKQVTQNYPLIPIILISAVGGFDEGALAKEYGAMSVLSKGQLAKQGESLDTLLKKALNQRESNRKRFDIIDQIRSMDNPDVEALTKLREIMVSEDSSPYIKGEALEVYYNLQPSTVIQESKNALVQATQASERMEINIDRDLERFQFLQEESMDSLRTAEFLYRYQESVPEGYDFSRNIGFSYCFAIENEVKSKFRHRLPKFLKTATTYDILSGLYDNRMKNIDLFFQQYLLRLQQIKQLDFQVDKIKQVLEKLILHKDRYKPDGLKAMGVLILCFGRNYNLMTSKAKMDINNPLTLKGLDNDDDILILSHQLIRLQHFRNPYIHPEITVREKTHIIRDAALSCLDYVSRLEE